MGIFVVLTAAGHSRYGQQGMTLVDLLVAIVLSLFVISTTLTVFITSFQSHVQNLQTTRLNQELRVIMDLISADLRRAGHWGYAASTAAKILNEQLHLDGNLNTVNVQAPIPSALTDLGAAADGLKFFTLISGIAHRGTVHTDDGLSFTLELDPRDGTLPISTLRKGEWALIDDDFPIITLVDQAEQDCILYVTDLNGDGLLTIDNPDERLGLRHDPVSLTLERRRTGTDCNGDGWVTLSNELGTGITAFDIVERTATRNLDSSVPAKLQIQVREFEIRLRGRLKGSPEVERELVQVVNTRNDRVVLL